MTSTANPGQLHSNHEKMVCKNCFRSKADGGVASLCSNPKCQFYECSTTSSLSPEDASIKVGSGDTSSNSSFAKEVGYSRRLKAVGQMTLDIHPSVWKFPSNFELQVLSEPQSVDGSLLELPKINVNYETSPNPWMRTSRLYEGTASDSFFSSSLAICDQLDSSRSELDKNGGLLNSTHAGFTGLNDGSSLARATIASQVPAVASVASNTANAFDMRTLSMQLPPLDSQRRIQKILQERGSPLALSIKDTAGHPSVYGLNLCPDTYSRKVFIGGLPGDMFESEIRIFFVRFGPVTVDWPHKNCVKACTPPKGYAFLLFQNESAVHKLLLECVREGDKHFIYLHCGSLVNKKVQIRPWYLADIYHCMDSSCPKDFRKAVFVGGVPRPLKASELGQALAERYGNVAHVQIDVDSELKYPKGAACVMFSSKTSYIAAVAAQFMKLSYGSFDKQVEIKPYVLDGQECDECKGRQSGCKPASFFCGSVTCLQYYCEICWGIVHSKSTHQNHRPLVKELGNKSRYS